MQKDEKIQVRYRPGLARPYSSQKSVGPWCVIWPSGESPIFSNVRGFETWKEAIDFADKVEIVVICSQSSGSQELQAL